MSDEDMPTFVIKGKDALAVPALRAYQQECEQHGLSRQAHEVEKAILEFQWWQATNETKLPDHKHVPARAS